ncbi:transposon Tf2-9 polyprotein [Trichonephila clavipes]|nr:transposon Tf2-9 polyprotein [Trichonephila clavipes]
MLELFLQQLPTAVQTILASITPITVEKAEEVADRILELHISRRLFIKDKSSNTAFLIDTGSDVSVLPASLSEKGKATVFSNCQPLIHLLSTFTLHHHLKPSISNIFGCFFQRLDQYGLSINPSKCTFGVPTLNFLGFQVCSSGIKPLEDRVEAIFKFPKPTTITQLRRFLGMLNYYRRFIRQAAHILAPLVKFLKGIRNKKRPKRKVKIKPEEALEWTDEATTAFELVKQSLAHATLLHHPMPNAPLSIWVDASDFAVGGALAQFHDNVWQPLAFLSMKISASQKNWSTRPKLLAIYTMVKRFQHMLEGRTPGFYLPVLYNIQHVPGTQNLVADALSRIEIDSISQASCLDYKDIAAAQLVDEELKQLLETNSTSLTLKQQYFPLEDITLTCDVSTNVFRPFIPKDYRKIVFQHLHGLSHPGIAASTKLATQRFVWPNIRRDIKTWVNSCHPCQRSKIYRHTKAPIGTFALPDARFSQIHVDFIGPFPPSNGQSYCLTVVDRFTRWMEVIPTADMTAETVCRALLSVWISRFGCPAIITTDQGTNFESSLFRELNNILGTNRIRCCAYHQKPMVLLKDCIAISKVPSKHMRIQSGAKSFQLYFSACVLL